MVSFIETEMLSNAMHRLEEDQQVEPEAAGMWHHASFTCHNPVAPEKGACQPRQEKNKSEVISVSMEQVC